MRPRNRAVRVLGADVRLDEGVDRRTGGKEGEERGASVLSGEEEGLGSP